MLITFAMVLIFAISLLVFVNYQNRALKNKAKDTQLELERLRATLDEITGETRRSHENALTPELTDTLTGLPHRKVFDDRVTQTLNHCSRQKSLFAIIALDIDHFAEVEKQGHDVGDKLLQDFSRRMQLSVRQVDTATRVAGGYFLFLLPHLARAETAIYVAQRIQDNLLEPFRINSKEFILTVSMGISVYPVDGTDVETLIKNADTAMRQAKSSGKNKYQFFQNELHHLGERELSIVQLIRSPNLFQQLKMQYRPFFNVGKKQPIYIQATPHVHHPRYGMVAQHDFNRIAENSGKMLEVHEWLLRNALNKFKQWHKDGFSPMILAIPVSLRQLEHAHFIYKIREIREELNAEHIKLVLEISDDNVPQNTAYIENLFIMLGESNIEAAVGVIALGHFAMQKISKIPLSYLKIDSKLINAAMQHQEKENILSKIIELALDEKITVIAEGVENEQQMNRLSKLGCTLMEGKHFGYLMPTGSILEIEA